MFEQSSTFEYRLTQEAINLRKQAEGMPLSIRRDDLLRKATEIDAAASAFDARQAPNGAC